MTKHVLSTRLWHWVNTISLIVLFMSGLNISNAHRYLYWGHSGFDRADAWTQVVRFPGWMTIPDYYSLAVARDWHLLFAWPFAFGLLLFMIAALLNGHAKRDLTTRRNDWKWASIKQDIGAHLKLNFDHGDGKYNFLQRLSYGLVIFIGLPLMIFTGLAMSPAMDANWPILVDVFGGRQSARSIHFIVAFGLFAFFILHIVMVLLAGPVGQLRDMILGGKTAGDALSDPSIQTGAGEGS
ncbi:cytochrome b/b6 domain-containing protein [Altererythrobacter aquiaggeris]|uniref:cytochrome b/b6 domain-containing protein n=1 Tax=Aestuarierythrobacter aquiaggeris TaxID=1898396 RepID=UPI003018B67E